MNPWRVMRSRSCSRPVGVSGKVYGLASQGLVVRAEMICSILAHTKSHKLAN